ncbi:uncharacterized protein [Drosophila bipectinata]|uniref:uncharacterized protein n=1 Tax=Drosophila bipectinata TaxID=42026 RepID=UPI001C8968A6|nr:uncharacterized protein LOC108129094 [Drosophila bipectinata]
MDTSVNTRADDQANSSLRLHCSLSSVEMENEMEMEAESDLSLAFERDEDAGQSGGSWDELPAFEIRAFCPHGRTPSPIDDLNLSDIETPKQQLHHQSSEELRYNNPEFVALHDINAQISPPSDADTSKSSNNLETIFEGVFLHTPPREKANAAGSPSSTRFTPKRSRANLMELVAIGNRLNGGKENQSPCAHLSKSPAQSPTKDPT